MIRPYTSRSLLASAAVAVGTGALLATACGDPVHTAAPTALAHAGHDASLGANARSATVEEQVAQLRALTAPFHRFEAAAEAGWDTPIPGCFEDPELGGMGYHFGNAALIDGAVDALQPELLVYEPQKNGRLRLVAVEYIVPFDLWTSPEPPRLYELSFHRNEAFGLWVLHVWHFRDNPAGMFMDWNPAVSCRYATP